MAEYQDYVKKNPNDSLEKKSQRRQQMMNKINAQYLKYKSKMITKRQNEINKN